MEDIDVNGNLQVGTFKKRFKEAFGTEQSLQIKVRRINKYRTRCKSLSQSQLWPVFVRKAKKSRFDN